MQLVSYVTTSSHLIYVQLEFSQEWGMGETEKNICINNSKDFTKVNSP